MLHFQRITPFLFGTLIAYGGAVRDPSGCRTITNQQKQDYSMKLNRIITLCAVAAALAFSAGSSFAQDNPPGDNAGGAGGAQRRNGGGGPGGGRNFDPAAMQQRMMDNIRDQLNFTNDTDWSAVQPLVQKVMDARRDVGGQGLRGLFGRNRGGQGGQGGGPRGGMFGQPSPEQEALQKALDDNAPVGQVKDLLAKYKASQEARQAKLEAAQDALKAVLTPRQEAQACLLGLVR
jgi:Spy/CpxP family protein refolding chaperone